MPGSGKFITDISFKNLPSMWSRQNTIIIHVWFNNIDLKRISVLLITWFLIHTNMFDHFVHTFHMRWSWDQHLTSWETQRGHNFFLNVMNLIKFGLILNVNTSTPFYSWVCLILYSSSMVNSMGTKRSANDKHSWSSLAFY